MVLLVSVWHPHSAWADWGLAGAQYLCDGKANSFEILPYDRSSDDPPEGVPLHLGFKEITADHPAVTCKIGERTLHASIAVLSPGNGQCEGAGLVRAESISVGGVELLPDRPLFNWACDASDVPLTKIRVALRQADLAVERCYTPMGQAGTAPATHCDTKEINIDSVASATAKQNNDLANLATQASQAAALLPRENNFANVFLPPDPGPVATPACAHWMSSFTRTVGAMSDPTVLIPHGRIAGKVGDRVYIHPANPQVCEANSEPLCRAKAYVIPGDRVDIGFICGAWTYIRYPARTNASHDILGWVGTDQLYAVDSMIAASPEKSNSRDKTGHDALVAAVANNDLGRVKELLADGRDPNGADMSGYALVVAVMNRNLALVRLLLASHADPNTHPAVTVCGQLLFSAVFTTQEIFETLVKSGMKLNCGSESVLPWLAGTDRINDVDFSLSMNGLWAPKRDLSLLVNRLIAAGVPVNSLRTNDGATALYATSTNNNVDVARALLKAGASPNLVSNASAVGGNTTALMQAISAYARFLDPTMVRVLLEGGANPNYKTPGNYYNQKDFMWNNTSAGVTPLHITAENGYFALTQILLEHGADPHIARSDSALAADIARTNGHPAVAALIAGYPARH
jgi:ankyrin repeat protein